MFYAYSTSDNMFCLINLHWKLVMNVHLNNVMNFILTTFKRTSFLSHLVKDNWNINLPKIMLSWYIRHSQTWDLFHIIFWCISPIIFQNKHKSRCSNVVKSFRISRNSFVYVFFIDHIYRSPFSTLRTLVYYLFFNERIVFVIYLVCRFFT